MKKLIMMLMLLAGQAKAVCVGTLNPIDELSPRPTLMRDAADGRWQAGGSIDAWDLSCDAFGARRKILDLGPYSTWNLPGAEAGAWNYGIHAGISASYLSSALNHYTGIMDPMAALAQLSNKWKPLQYASAILSIDGTAGYRPHLTGDLQHNFVYGFALVLNVKWTQKQTIDTVNAGL